MHLLLQTPTKQKLEMNINELIMKSLVRASSLPYVPGSYDLSFKLKTVIFVEGKTKEAAAHEFHKVLATHQLLMDSPIVVLSLINPGLVLAPVLY